MLRRIASSLLAISLVVFGASVPLNFAQRSVPIRAGVLIIDSATYSSGISEPANHAPYVWYNLDANQGAKPAGWYFYNPSAQATVTAAIRSRWLQASAIVGGGAPAMDAQLTKRDASYWEVNLSKASSEQLANYDVLLLAAHGNTSLKPSDREKLRKFVDRGGLLWIDLTGGASINAPFGSSIDLVNGLPVSFALSNSATGLGPWTDYTHPIFNYPFPMTWQNIAMIGTDTTYGLKAADLNDVGAGNLASIQQFLRLDYEKLKPVNASAVGPTIAVAKVGNGSLVVTTQGVATTLNRAVVSGVIQPNQQSRALNGVGDLPSNAAAKLVVNMIALLSNYAEPGRGTHRLNSSPIDIGAPLLKRFDAPLPLNPGQNNYIPPTVYKGLVIVCSNDTVYAYSAKPGSDLDGDGNPDDGVPDFGAGSNYDLIWQSQSLSGPISSATCIEVPGAAVKDQVLVQDSAGTVYAFSAFGKDALGRLTPAPTLVYTVSPPNGSSSVDTSFEGRGPYAPTYHEGLVYVADTEGSHGRVWVFDPVTGGKIATGGNEWVVGTDAAPVMNPIGGPPTVGYIPIADNSGGLDKVAYTITQPVSSGSGTNTTAGISSVWIGARSEKPIKTIEIVAGTQLQVTTRASLKGARIYLPSGESRIGVKLTLIRADGTPYTASQLNSVLDGTVSQPAPGVLRFGMRSASAIDPAQVSARLDYTLDWGVAGASNLALRGNLFFPDDSSKSRRILHHLALAPNGTLFATVSDQRRGGSLFAVREEGQGSFKLVYRYDLYPEHQVSLNQTNSVTYGPTFLDSDPLNTTIVPFLSGKFTNLSMQSGPAIHDGIVYVTARGTKSIGGFGAIDEFTLLLAFNANPEAFDIKVPKIDGAFSVVQPDMLRSPDLTAPTTFSTLPSNQFRYENTSDDKGIIRFDNLMTSTRGLMQNALSVSQPVIIRKPNQPDEWVVPEKNSSRWSPLLHYMVITGLKNSTPPFISGETVFVGGVSRLPNLVSGGLVLDPARGLLYGIASSISPNDSFLVANSTRPWQSQLYQVLTDPAGLKGNPNTKWPQASGAMSFDDWRLRVLQTTVGASTGFYGLVCGEGGLFAWTNLGLWGFDRSDFIVCDEGRVSRFDPSGNPLWSTDTSQSSGRTVDDVSASVLKPLVRPTRAYPFGTSDMLVVDSGANRIVRLDASAREVRSISFFKLDGKFVPDGFETNETPELRDPRDVLTFFTYETNPSKMSNPKPLEYWVHYVIADTGNKRLIELVDRYEVDPISRAIVQPIDLGVLYWHSPSALSGKKFDYNSVARAWVADGGGRYVYACGIGSSMPTRADTGLDTPTTTSIREDQTGNGGIVIYDGANSEVINSVIVPGIDANVIYDGLTGLLNADPIPQKNKRMANISSVTMRNVLIDTNGDGTTEPKLAIMFTDNTGVYEIVKVGSDWKVIWMMTREVYKALRRNGAGVILPSNPREFRPTFARRLNSGEVIIVNGYVGTKLSNDQFNGEILQIDGTLPAGVYSSGFRFSALNLGFNTTSIKFELPPVQGTRGIILPVYADRK